MTRDEHLAWSKQRALEYLDRGELENAVASMGSDLSKHPDCKDVADNLMPLGLHYLFKHDSDGIRRWIVGFH
jgi:hypothetical protein